MKKIKNIIFDFGGVIINLDTETPLQLMSLHSKLDINEVWLELQKTKVFELYETGLLTDDEFRNSIRNFFNINIDDELNDQIWNSMLLNIPHERIKTIEKCHEHYRIFLLSNSNPIHYKHYSSQLKLKFGYDNFDQLFDKAYFSFEIKKLKPAAEIFNHVIEEQNLVLEETLFIDDVIANIHAAQSLGLNVIHLKENMDIVNLFDENGVLKNTISTTL